MRVDKVFFCEEAQQVDDLSRRLRAFYDETEEYIAFHSPSSQTKLWGFVADGIKARAQKTPDAKLRVLEVGAGRSGFSHFLANQGLRSRVSLHAQDVTYANRQWLKDNCDDVTIGGVDDVQGSFDIVLSSYVLEHVTRPADFLERIWGLLRCGGSVFITCPRYDFPFYLPRSADHLSAVQRFHLGISLICRRLRTMATRRPAWLIHKDPAVFHMPFARDRDAVHWVSWFDLRALWPDLVRLKLKSFGLRDTFRIRCLTIALRRDKPERCDATGARQDVIA